MESHSSSDFELASSSPSLSKVDLLEHFLKTEDLDDAHNISRDIENSAKNKMRIKYVHWMILLKIIRSSDADAKSFLIPIHSNLINATDTF